METNFSCYQQKIDDVFEKYGVGIYKSQKEKGLTQYEKAFGFTEETRLGSRHFCNYLGHFMERIWNCSGKITLQNRNKIDAESKIALYQFKNKFNTMKQSMAFNEIKPMLEQAIVEGKNFYLVILVDKKDSRNIPLHKGFSLSKIKDIEGYDSGKHLWISGSYIYEHFFPECPEDVYKYILKKLKEI